MGSPDQFFSTHRPPLPSGCTRNNRWVMEDCCWPATCEWVYSLLVVTYVKKIVCVVTFYIHGHWNCLYILDNCALIVLLSCRMHGGNDCRLPQLHEDADQTAVLPQRTTQGSMKSTQLTITLALSDAWPQRKGWWFGLRNSSAIIQLGGESPIDWKTDNKLRFIKLLYQIIVLCLDVLNRVSESNKICTNYHFLVDAPFKSAGRSWK